MEIILLEKVRNLGSLGDKVNVKPGYGRNFLIPQGKAVPANAKNLADFAARRQALEAQAAEVLQKAQQRASKLEGKVVTIAVKASEEGKLYGSIGTREIAQTLSEQGEPVEKREVILPQGTLRNLGEYAVELQLHSDVTVPVKINITAEA